MHGSKSALATNPYGLPPARSALVRMLGAISEVRASEVGTALLLTLDAALLLTSYSCIKPVREALILGLPSGAEYKIYMAAATAVALLFAVPVYAKVAVGLPRDRLIVRVTAFFASHLLLFYVWHASAGPSLPLALCFYLWIAVFNMMIVAQFWGFTNDIYAEEAGKRLFPLFGLGASAGAVVGSAIAQRLIGLWGMTSLLLVAAVLLLLSAAVTQWVHQRELRGGTRNPRAELAALPIGGERGDAFGLVLRSRYLRWIAGFSLLFTLVKTNGDYVLARLVKDAASGSSAGSAGQFIGTFYANYFFYVDLVSLGLQAFAVSRVLKYLGTRRAFYILPALALVDAAATSLLPFLSVARVGKVVESATDYSLNNTVRNLLWLPTTRREKYVAKQTVDTFFVRLGDVSSAAFVFLGGHWLGWSVVPFAACNVALTSCWLGAAGVILRERARLIRERPVAA